MVVTETASLIALNGSHSSIQVSVTQSDATTFLSEQPTQPDESTIVVVPETRQLTELETLERRLDEVMQERVQLSAQLQQMLEGHDLRAPIFGYSFLMPGIEAMKLIGFFRLVVSSHSFHLHERSIHVVGAFRIDFVDSIGLWILDRRTLLFVAVRYELCLRVVSWCDANSNHWITVV
ncbi:hypothetical protein M3Y94_00690200 [Aphelenchoides besseyi]|nr:hypothetical protein M3Y94_00690200 [Aphelenchoides besseyi]